MKKMMLLLVLLVFAWVVSVQALDASAQKEGYALHNQHCVLGHDSVADPEKPGFTRDTWFLILNVMHEKYGMETLSEQTKAKLVDYLYTFRKGMEREAG